MVEHFGQTGYDAIGNNVREELYDSDKWEKEIEVSSNSTETHTFEDFPVSEAVFVYIQVIVDTGSTDLDLSIHEGTSFDKSDLIFRVEGASANDSEPTGGFPSSANGLPYEEENGNNQIHIETVENSGNDGSVTIKVRHVNVKD